jgi:hypothetical protein
VAIEKYPRSGVSWAALLYTGTSRQGLVSREGRGARSMSAQALR